MVKRYKDCRLAPVSVVSAVSAETGINSIVDARVDDSGSLIFEIALGDEPAVGDLITAECINSIAEALGTESGNIFVEPGSDKSIVLAIVGLRTADFTDEDYIVSAQEVEEMSDEEFLQFGLRLEGEEDSEESIEASENLSKQRSGCGGGSCGGCKG